MKIELNNYDNTSLYAIAFWATDFISMLVEKTGMDINGRTQPHARSMKFELTWLTEQEIADIKKALELEHGYEALKSDVPIADILA